MSRRWCDMTTPSVLSQYRDLPREEWAPSLLLSGYFFLVIATFWVLKPLKRGLLIHYFSNRPIEWLGLRFDGAEAEQIAKFLNMICALVVAMLFTVIVRRYKRQKLVWLCSAFFAAAFAAFAAVIGHPTELLVWSFYVFGDMFNTVMVVLFWAFTNDLSTSDQARRTYGLIGFGGVLGGFAGATAVSSTVEDYSRVPLLLGCVASMVLISVLAYFIGKRAKPDRSPVGSHATELSLRDSFDGARLVFRSRYLLAIAGIVFVYEVTSNVIDFQLATVVEKQIPEPLKKAAFFATVGQLTGIVSIVVQLFLTGWIMTRFGLRPALLFLPLSIAAGSMGFLVFPSLIFAGIMSASDNALNYSINQSSKEALYAPTSADVKYKAKAFIDMFLQRFAKALSVILNLAFAAVAGISVRWLSVFTLAVLAVWILFVMIASAEFHRESRKEKTAARRSGSKLVVREA